MSPLTGGRKTVEMYGLKLWRPDSEIKVSAGPCFLQRLQGDSCPGPSLATRDVRPLQLHLAPVRVCLCVTSHRTAVLPDLGPSLFQNDLILT